MFYSSWEKYNFVVYVFLVDKKSETNSNCELLRTCSKMLEKLKQEDDDVRKKVGDGGMNNYFSILYSKKIKPLFMHEKKNEKFEIENREIH